MRAAVMPAAVIAALCPVSPVAASDARSPYAGEQSRSIKALSEDDILALRNGDGMGLAKAAELNGYPGPRHALDLAGELRLSEIQIRQVTAIHERMNTAARALGTALIERERRLDALFAGGTITPEDLAAETERIGEIQARLRAIHLAAHVEVRAILNRDQVAAYNRLRGYNSPAAPRTDHPGGPPAGHRH